MDDSALGFVSAPTILLLKRGREDVAAHWWRRHVPVLPEPCRVSAAWLVTPKLLSFWQVKEAGVLLQDSRRRMGPPEAAFSKVQLHFSVILFTGM